MNTYTQASPSVSEYFSWINHSNEGPNEEQTLTNLRFFQWLKKETGAQLDIYALDEGVLDMLKNQYMDFSSPHFKEKFPHGLAPIAKAAEEAGMYLGVWLGPDGFGSTPEELNKRRELLVSLCRDYRVILFKFDAVCGTLRPEYIDAWMETIRECRKYTPQLIVLNHRIPLGEGQKLCSTYLWQSKETYIDAHYPNASTALHHRMGPLSRENPPNLDRLVEDHGVCISSCNDFWTDDFVLQAFGRNLLLSPQIYGNPWLLREDELRTIGWLIALHRRYRDILPEAQALPEEIFGPYAVARGNHHTLFVVLRNLTWVSKTVCFSPHQECQMVNSRLHAVEITPYIFDHGCLNPGDTLSIQVPPMRVVLVLLSEEELSFPVLENVSSRILRENEDSTWVRIYGYPGEQLRFSLPKTHQYQQAMVDERSCPSLLEGAVQHHTFAGEIPERDVKYLTSLKTVPVPPDAERWYETCMFAADNNSFEVRSLLRSGVCDVPEIEACRKAYFEQDAFVYRGVWDRFAFDGRDDTFFMASVYEKDQRIAGGALRFDVGKAYSSGTLELCFYCEDGETIEDLRVEGSKDLNGFVRLEQAEEPQVEPASFREFTRSFAILGILHGKRCTVRYRFTQPLRYFRIFHAPVRVNNISIHAQEQIDLTLFRANNLFPAYFTNPVRGWKTGQFHLGTVAPGSYLCVACNGNHRQDGVYAALELADGTRIGASDKAPSFPCNAFESGTRRQERNNTFYFPLHPDMCNTDVRVHVLILRNGLDAFESEVYIAQPDTMPCHVDILLKK